MQVLGRAFPVQLMYAPEPQPDYVEAAVTTVLQLHMDAAPGDVLVFLTGQVPHLHPNLHPTFRP